MKAYPRSMAKKQEKHGVGNISSLFQRLNRLNYTQAMLYIYKVQSWQDVVRQLSEAH